MALQDMIEKPEDMNAPPVFDSVKARKLTNDYLYFGQSPHTALIFALGRQLTAALAIIDKSSASVETARADTSRYEQESKIANAEVKTMQDLLVKAREERDAALKELEALKPKPAAAPKKRARPGKVVPITAEKKAAG